MKIINRPVFKVSVKNNWKMAVIHLIVGVAFFVLIFLVMQLSDVGVTSKEQIGFVIARQTTGMFTFSGNLSNVLLVFLITVGGGFINRPALDGSLSTYLTTPVSRKNYTITTLLAYYTMITALIAILSLVGLTVMFSFFNTATIKAVYVANYFAVVGVFTLVTLTIAAISYFTATLFAGTKIKGMYVIIPILFFIISAFALIGDVVNELKFLRYLTPYSWFSLAYLFPNNTGIDLDSAVFGSTSSFNWWDKNPWLPALLCLVIIAACSVMSVIIYRKKKFAV